MNIVVFGSTGGTGKEIVKQALHAGHHVRAAARTPSKMTVTHPNLEVFQADLYDPESVKKAVAGTDAVLSAVAPAGLSLWETTDLFTQSAKVILPAMRLNSVKRLLVVSTSARRTYSRENHPIFEFIIKRIFWRTLYSNVVAMDDVITQADIDWTLVRPPQVVDHPPTGNYRVAEGHYAVAGGSTIGRIDLATYMVSIIGNEHLYRQNVAIAY